MKLIKKYSIILLILALCMSTFPVSAKEESKQQEAFSYLAIGDSIAKGYSCDEEVIMPYPSLVQEELNARPERGGKLVELSNIAKNGISTARFNTLLLEKEEVLTRVQEADLITITIGANDLIDEFKRASQEVLGESQRFFSLSDAMEVLDAQVKVHPTLVLKAIGAIAGWDYDTFEADYCKMMERIRSEAKDSTQIVVTTIYNPTTNLGMPGTLNRIVDGIIKKMNEIIEMHAEEYDYQVVDLVESDICEYVQTDGLHPTQEGQALIAEVVLSQIEWGLPGEEESGEPKKQTSKRVDAWGTIAVVSVGITGSLLLYLGLSKNAKGKKREE